MRIKTTTYSDVRQKPCQFYWHGLLHITIGIHFSRRRLYLYGMDLFRNVLRFLVLRTR
jgi:hypothetical protein